MPSFRSRLQRLTPTTITPSLREFVHHAGFTHEGTGQSRLPSDWEAWVQQTEKRTSLVGYEPRTSRIFLYRQEEDIPNPVDRTIELVHEYFDALDELRNLDDKRHARSQFPAVIGFTAATVAFNPLLGIGGALAIDYVHSVRTEWRLGDELKEVREKYPNALAYSYEGRFFHGDAAIALIAAGAARSGRYSVPHDVTF